MSWSLRLVRVMGTVIRIHVTFPLLLIWVAAVSWPSGGAAAAAMAIVFVLLVFVCVVLHELGHAAAARWYGIRTPDITVLPIGGLARLERIPSRPTEELVVAVAGPLVNVVIAAILFLVVGVRFDLTQMAQLEAAGATLLGRLAAVNVLLVLFNMIPAFPLDGGRVLRALLSIRWERARATRIAARIGQAFAVVFAGLGLMGNPFLVLIAVFLIFAAEQEAGYETRRSTATGHVARDAMVTRFETLSPTATAEDAGNLLLVTTQQEFPVIDTGGQPLGIVTRRRLIEAMKDGGPRMPVREFMETEFPEVGEETPLETVLEALGNSPARVVAVRGRGRRLVGYVSAENASEFFMLAEADRERRRPGGLAPS